VEIFYLVGSGNFLIKNDKSNLCLSILNDHTGVGGKVVQETCDASGPSGAFQRCNELDKSAHGVEFASVGDGGLVAHPAVCTSAIGAEIYMSVSDQCRVDFWTLQ
jgi:hypothetical protein